MLENNKGHIVTIASMAGKAGISKLVDYCASKHAAVGFDEALRFEFAVRQRLTVANMSPPTTLSTNGRFFTLSSN